MSKKTIKRLGKHLTVGDLMEMLQYQPEEAVIAVYVGGPDAQNWIARTIETGKAPVIMDMYGKNSTPCLGEDVSDEDDSYIKEEYPDHEIKPFVLINIYG